MTSIAKLLSRIGGDLSGTAMTEFALSLPLLLTAGLYGAETANLALCHMKVSQLAIHLADNASRIGDTSQITSRKIFEDDVNDLLVGSNIQGGPTLDFYEHGRSIVSGYEVFDSSMSCTGGGCPHGPHPDGTLFIHWQRCKGIKVWASNYGDEDDVLPSGIGPTGQEVTPEPGGAVIFAEVAYDYQPLVSSRFFGPTTITAISSFIVRDNIDLSGLKQRKPLSPVTPARCNVHDSYSTSSGGGGGSSGGGGGSSSSSGGSSSSSSGGSSSSSSGGSSSSSSGGSSSSSGGSSSGGGSSS